MGMRVTLIGHYPPPYGGVASLMKQMEAALVSSGCGVSIFNLGHGEPPGSHVTNFDTGNRVREVAQLRRALAASDSDVFHYLSASYRSFWMGAVCLTLARLTRRTIVVSFVGGAFPDFLNELGPIKRAAARRVLSFASALMPCNDDIRAALGRLGVAAPMTQMTNTFPMDGSSESALPADVERFVASHGPIVSSTGAASVEYGLLNAVEALRRLRDEHPGIGMVLVLTSYGSSVHENEVLQAVKEASLEDRVLIARDIPDFLALLRRSDVFLRSALVDGDSMSVREALSLGVPTVASDTAFRPDGAIVYRKNDVDDLTAKMKKALSLGDSAAAHSHEEAERNLRTLLGVYSDVAGRR